MEIQIQNQIQKLSIEIKKMQEEGIQLVNDLFEGKEGAEEKMRLRDKKYNKLYKQRQILSDKL